MISDVVYPITIGGYVRFEGNHVCAFHARISIRDELIFVNAIPDDLGRPRCRCMIRIGLDICSRTGTEDRES